MAKTRCCSQGSTTLGEMDMRVYDGEFYTAGLYNRGCSPDEDPDVSFPTDC